MRKIISDKSEYLLTTQTKKGEINCVSELIEFWNKKVRPKLSNFFKNPQLLSIIDELDHQIEKFENQISIPHSPPKNLFKQKSVSNLLSSTKKIKNAFVPLDSSLIIKEEDDNAIITNLKKNSLSSPMFNDETEIENENIDNIIAYDLQLNSLNNLVEICNDNSVKNIYVPSDFNYSELSKRIPNINIFELNVEVGSLRLETVHYDGYIIAVYLKTSLGTVLIPEIKPNKKEARFLMDNFSKVDILYLNNTDTNLGVYNISHKRLVCNKSLEPNVISLDKTGFYILNKYKEGFAL